MVHFILRMSPLPLFQYSIAIWLSLGLIFFGECCLQMEFLERSPLWQNLSLPLVVYVSKNKTLRDQLSHRTAITLLTPVSHRVSRHSYLLVFMFVSLLSNLSFPRKWEVSKYCCLFWYFLSDLIFLKGLRFGNLALLIGNTSKHIAASSSVASGLMLLLFLSLLVFVINLTSCQ